MTQEWMSARHGVAAHAFNPTTGEADTARSLPPKYFLGSAFYDFIFGNHLLIGETCHGEDYQGRLEASDHTPWPFPLQAQK